MMLGLFAIPLANARIVLSGKAKLNGFASQLRRVGFVQELLCGERFLLGYDFLHVFLKRVVKKAANQATLRDCRKVTTIITFDCPTGK